jgi:pimeloyl-ACP methyl ester carboxylesterase
VSGTYEISATLCTPDCGPGTTVQLLTHGVTLDKSYWDVPFDNYNYSYVSTAVDGYGYSTFAWDLLGVGGSGRGDAVNELQSNLQNAALYALTQTLRAGGIPGVKPFKKVVHVGHSYGSIQTYTLGVRYPQSSDGLILTGFSQSGIGYTGFLLGGNYDVANSRPALASYPAGYLSFGTPSGVQTAFFGPGAFDPAVLEYTFDTISAATVGEMLTLSADIGLPSSFQGPVLVITGGGFGHWTNF